MYLGINVGRAGQVSRTWGHDACQSRFDGVNAGQFLLKVARRSIEQVRRRGETRKGAQVRNLVSLTLELPKRRRSQRFTFVASSSKARLKSACEGRRHFSVDLALSSEGCLTVADYRNSLARSLIKSALSKQSKVDERKFRK